MRPSRKANDWQDANLGGEDPPGMTRHRTAYETGHLRDLEIACHFSKLLELTEAAPKHHGESSTVTQVSADYFGGLGGRWK